MKTRNGGQEAKAGFWWNIRSWEITLIKSSGDRLPGGDAVKYVRVPTVALVLLGPMMGAMFVMFLPFIGFAMLLGAIATKVAKSVAAVGRSAGERIRLGAARSATPNGAAAPTGGSGESGAGSDRSTPRD